MNKIIKKISGAVQLVLMAPIKLPTKALQVLKYVAIGLGILENVLEDEKPTKVSSLDKKEGDEE